MLKSNRILCLDVGASKLVLAEFSLAKPLGLELINYGVGEIETMQEGTTANSAAYIVATIKDVMRENGIKPAPLLMTVSGQSVFPRFVKLPAVAPDKIAQIVRYEAEQNVPFPIEEVVWDYYQLMESEEEDDLNVMLVAVKREIVQSLTDCVQGAGLEPEVIDAAPMALYNTVRYNYPDLEGCTMVLDIGARSSNLIFVEGSRIFSRSIPVAGNAITQEIVKEFEVSFEEAEELKKQHAFVAFGGVYGGPDSEVADRVSKLVRNVITRLHAEANRSINFYRSQQGGSAPSLVLLTGGSSIIPHTDTFFRERLKAEVEYLNPFANVAVSEQIDSDRIGSELHLMGEVVGLSLRKALSCPVEVNLMPPSLVAKKVFRKRQPFFAVAAVGLILIMLCGLVYVKHMGKVREKQIARVEERIRQFKIVADELQQAIRQQQQVDARLTRLVEVAEERVRWPQVVAAIHKNMLEGMWLQEMRPIEVNDEIVAVEIKGHGFGNNLSEIEAASDSGANAIEIFRDRLRNDSLFDAENTRITEYPPTGADAFARAFTLRVRLAKPIVLKRS